jgi:cyclic dehypoxanthinyl futalosine synthase
LASETVSQRIEHLEKLRRLQQRTLDSGQPGFVSFIPWTFQPDNTPIDKIIPDRMPGEEYLRWLALAQLYLNNIPNVQVSWLTVGLKDGRRGLHFGANDVGSTMIDDDRRERDLKGRRESQSDRADAGQRDH